MYSKLVVIAGCKMGKPKVNAIHWWAKPWKDCLSHHRRVHTTMTTSYYNWTCLIRLMAYNPMGIKEYVVVEPFTPPRQQPTQCLVLGSHGSVAQAPFYVENIWEIWLQISACTQNIVIDKHNLQNAVCSQTSLCNIHKRQFNSVLYIYDDNYKYTHCRKESCKQ